MIKEKDVFYRVKHLGKLQPSDHWDAYQIETIKFENGKWKKAAFDKPDVKQIVLAKLETLLMDEEWAENKWTEML